MALRAPWGQMQGSATTAMREHRRVMAPRGPGELEAATLAPCQFASLGRVRAGHAARIHFSSLLAGRCVTIRDCPLRARISSMNSRTAPCPPGLWSTTSAALRAAGTASDGQAESAAASNIGMSGSSSPIAAICARDRPEPAPYRLHRGRPCRARPGSRTARRARVRAAPWRASVRPEIQHRVIPAAAALRMPWPSFVSNTLNSLPRPSR